MTLSQLSRAYNLRRDLDAAEGRMTTTGFRLAELMNKRVPNEAARLRAIDRCQDDLRDTFIEIKAIKAKLEAVTA